MTNSILKFTISRHHNTETPPYSVKRFIETNDMFQQYLEVAKLVQEAIEEDAFSNFESETWAMVEAELLRFWLEKTDKVELTFPVIDGEEERLILLYCEREKNGHLNMLYNLDGELDKYENRWFSFSILEDEFVDARRAELEEKTKDELIDIILLDSL